MSLTNPKKVVTEERLSEFYGGILPYLGGMPEVLANKFSKCDLYSETEKIVGCWIDGKPIYQKTITGTTNSNSDPKTFPIGALIDKVIGVESMVGASSETMYFPNNFWANTVSSNFISGFKLSIMTNSSSVSDNVVSIVASAASTISSPFHVTIKYTKPTDAANSFKYGNETDYSTDEKIIGTWIDGKPIYQKTINFGNLATANAYKSVNHSVSNFERLVSVKGIGIVNGTASYFDCSSWSAGATEVHTRVLVDNTAVSFYNPTGTDMSAFSAYFTIQYTKTTD